MGLGLAAALGILGAFLVLLRRRRKRGQKETHMPIMDNARNQRRQRILREPDVDARSIERAEVEG